MWVAGRGKRPDLVFAEESRCRWRANRVAKRGRRRNALCRCGLHRRWPGLHGRRGVGVVLIVADAPCFRSQCTLLGRLVQMHPPRRLGISSKLPLRFSIGRATWWDWPRRPPRLAFCIRRLFWCNMLILFD